MAEGQKIVGGVLGVNLRTPNVRILETRKNTLSLDSNLKDNITADTVRDLIDMAISMKRTASLSARNLSKLNLTDITFQQGTSVYDANLYLTNFAHSDIRGLKNLENAINLGHAIFFDTMATPEQQKAIRRAKDTVMAKMFRASDPVQDIKAPKLARK